MSTIVITGAAGALGSAVVKELSARKLDLALVDAPAAEGRAKELAASLGTKAFAYGADLADRKSWSALLPRIEKDLGTPTGAVLIAGTWLGGAPLHEEKDDSVWDALLAANLETARLAMRALLPGMVAKKDGSIVVIGSRAVERPWTSVNASAYAATKSAVVALASTVAAEVLEHRVRINAVLPSTIDTAANRKAMPQADASRWVATDSLAKIIGFLLSDDARDISGAALPVYGRA